MSGSSSGSLNGPYTAVYVAGLALSAGYLGFKMARHFWNKRNEPDPAVREAELRAARQRQQKQAAPKQERAGAGAGAGAGGGSGGGGVDFHAVDGAYCSDSESDAVWESEGSQSPRLAAAIAASRRSMESQSSQNLRQRRGGDRPALLREIFPPEAFEGLPEWRPSPTSQLREAKRHEDAALRAAQDDAYEQALLEAQRQEEENKARVEREIEAERQRVEAVEELQVRKSLALSRLPDEVPDTDPAAFAISVRLPSGARLQRRFQADDPIGNVVDWLETSMESPTTMTDMQLVSTYPSRVLFPPPSETGDSADARDTTLRDLGIVGSTALIVRPKSHMP